jgi:hypothetical protein
MKFCSQEAQIGTITPFLTNGVNAAPQLGQTWESEFMVGKFIPLRVKAIIPNCPLFSLTHINYLYLSTNPILRLIPPPA